VGNANTKGQRKSGATETEGMWDLSKSERVRCYRQNGKQEKVYRVEAMGGVPDGQIGRLRGDLPRRGRKKGSGPKNRRAMKGIKRGTGENKPKPDLK